jgi:hypothetical protein
LPSSESAPDELALHRVGTDAYRVPFHCDFADGDADCALIEAVDCAAQLPVGVALQAEHEAQPLRPYLQHARPDALEALQTPHSSPPVQ